MPLMKLIKDRVYASTLGHTVRFKAGEPVFVPPIVARECEQIGAVLVGKNDDTVETVNEDELASQVSDSINKAKIESGIPVEDKKEKQPVNPSDRMGVIIKGVHTLSDRNNREDFTAQGLPNLRALAKETGFRVDKSELAEAMKIINDPD